MKKLTKVLIGLAMVDFIDIAAKGHMMSAINAIHPEIGFNDEFEEAISNNKLIKCRGKMILKAGELCSWLFEKK